MLNVTLKIPLPAFHFAWLLQRDDTSTARIQMFHKPLNGPPLSGRVAPLEEDHNLLFRGLDPRLHLEQFHLQMVLLLFVAVTRQ